MKTPSFALLLAVVAVVPIHQAVAQSPEMPEPLAVVVDADGKPMVQVLGFHMESEHPRLEVLFEFEGIPVFTTLLVRNGALDNGSPVYFLTSDCTGPAFLEPFPTLSGALHRVQFTITGPDSIEGTFRVFRGSTLQTANVVPESKLFHEVPGLYSYTGCHEVTDGQLRTVSLAEEVIPNPLEGFHGPTAANPERLLTVKGGTRLPWATED